jgi:hypothetical protein
MQPSHTFQYPKVTPFVAPPPKPAAAPVAAAPRPQR